MGNEATRFKKGDIRAIEAGKKSKRRDYDLQLGESLESFLKSKDIHDEENRARKQVMLEAAYKQFLKGNHKPMAYLIDRAFGKARESVNVSGKIEKITTEVKRIERSDERVAKVLSVLIENGAIQSGDQAIIDSEIQ